MITDFNFFKVYGLIGDNTKEIKKSADVQNR